jgi:hypothetical protein
VNVSVDMEKGSITVDGETLRFRFPRSVTLKQITWDGAVCRMVATNGNEKEVGWDAIQPYVQAFQGEKDKRLARPALSVYKALRRRVIQAKREAAIATGVTWNGHVFDSDRQSIQNITLVGTIVALGATIPPNFGWRDKEGVFVPINTAAELRAFLVAIALHLKDRYVQAWGIEDAVEAAVTHEAVDAINWT